MGVWWGDDRLSSKQAKRNWLDPFLSGSEKSLLTIHVCFGRLGESKKMEFQLAMVTLNCDHPVVILYMKMDCAVFKNGMLNPICNGFLLDRNRCKTILNFILWFFKRSLFLYEKFWKCARTHSFFYSYIFQLWDGIMCHNTPWNLITHLSSISKFLSCLLFYHNGSEMVIFQASEFIFTRILYREQLFLSVFVPCRVSLSIGTL